MIAIMERMRLLREFINVGAPLGWFVERNPSSEDSPPADIAWEGAAAVVSETRHRPKCFALNRLTIGDKKESPAQARGQGIRSFEA
jgi:hypothetical protein